MTAAAAWRSEGWRIFVAATVGLLLAIGVMALQSSPAFASGTVTLSVQGKGDVTGSGVDCDETGGPDCSEFYEDVVVGEECDDGKPPRCFPITDLPQVTFTAGTDRNGYVLDGWTGCDTINGRECGATVDADRAVTARFRDAQGPSVGAGYTPVVDEGQTALNAGTYSDNAGGDVTFTASRGTVTKTGTSSGTWNWSMATDDGPGQGGPVTITGRDSSGNASTTTFNLTVNNVSPTATFNTPTSVNEGSAINLSLTNVVEPSSADAGSLQYRFDCGSGYGAYTTSSTANCPTTDSGSRTVRGQVKDKDGGISVEYARTVTVNNVAPTATFSAPQTSYYGKTFVVSLADPNDPSSADTSAGFLYAFNCGGGYGDFAASSVASCPTGGQGSQTVKGRVKDKDGGISVEYARTLALGPAPSTSYPNGSIAFESTRDGNQEIYTMNADGTRVANFTDHPASDSDPAFSPDGSKIAFVSRRDGDDEIYSMNLNGSGLTPLTDHPASDYSPAFSSDGSKIAFVSYRDDNHEIYVMNANGTGVTNLTNHSAHDYYPAFSPDGSKITFMSTRDGNHEIYTIDLDGTGLTRLTNHAEWNEAPVFSPNGSQLAFVSYRDGNAEIYVMNANGTGIIRLTSHFAHDYSPVFSPDGSKIAFHSSRGGGNNEVYVMNADGTSPANLTSHSAADRYPSWGGAGDTTPPETTIDSGPSVSVNSPSASFSFSSDPNSIFECSLDGAAFEPCSSPKEYTDLSEAEHTFEVRATDASLNTDPTPANRTWTVDLTAPSVTGVSPADLASDASEGTSATVTFSESSMDAATLNGTTFTLARQGTTTPLTAVVSYDAATSTATLNPSADLDPLATYTATLKGGSGAKDKAGNPLAIDKTWSFSTADTRPPSVSLTAPADGATVGGIVQLGAEATDKIAVERVEFLVNGMAVGSDVTAPYGRTWDSTSISSDTVRIAARAYDAAGNAATSAAHMVNVDNVAPETALDPSGPSSTVTSTSARFSFSSEAGATFQCKLDGETFVACSSPKDYTGLSDGSHTFSVRAVDAAGNVDTSPESRTWKVDATAPTIKSWTPTRKKASPKSKPAVVFSEKMDEASVEAEASNGLPTTFVLKKGTTVLPASVTYTETATGQYRAVLAPDRKLRPGTTYTATVTTAAKDAAGNALSVTKTWKFTVK